MEKSILKCAIMGHKTVWQHRSFILKIALLPLLVKALCTLVVYNMQVDIFHLRFFLVMLPSYILDGWLIAHVLRLLLLNEKHIEFPVRNPAVKATILFSVLAMMIQGGIVSLLPNTMDMLGLEKVTANWKPNIIEFGFYVLALVMAIWAMRLIWLYLPLSIGSSMKEFLREIKGYGTSIYMIGVWLAAMLPITIVLVLLPALTVPIEFETIYQLPTSLAIPVMVLRVLSEMISLLIVTASMAYMFLDILKKHGASPIFKD